jgi:hypothetical protein
VYPFCCWCSVRWYISICRRTSYRKLVSSMKSTAKLAFELHTSLNWDDELLMYLFVGLKSGWWALVFMYFLIYNCTYVTLPSKFLWLAFSRRNVHSVVWFIYSMLGVYLLLCKYLWIVHVLMQRLSGDRKYSSMYAETYIVAHLVETVHYKLEGCRFNSRWCHWDFSLT